MPKFYVESGNLQLVVHAKHARGAAIWAVHRVLSQLLPFLAEGAPPASGASNPPAALGELIRTSERGFGRDDGAVHNTFDVVCEWNRLIVALDKLQQETPAVAAVAM